jgi:hypothetical protein
VKTTTSKDGISVVFMCDRCDREQFAFVEEVQEHGLMPEEAEGIGWAETSDMLLCPICRSVL